MHTQRSPPGLRRCTTRSSPRNHSRRLDLKHRFQQRAVTCSDFPAVCSARHHRKGDATFHQHFAAPSWSKRVAALGLSLKGQGAVEDIAAGPYSGWRIPPERATPPFTSSYTALQSSVQELRGLPLAARECVALPHREFQLPRLRGGATHYREQHRQARKQESHRGSHNGLARTQCAERAAAGKGGDRSSCSLAVNAVYTLRGSPR